MVGRPSCPVSEWKRWHGFGWPFCVSWGCWALQGITSLNKVKNHSFSLSCDYTHQAQLVRTSDQAVQPHLAREPRRGEKRLCHFIADMGCWLWRAGPCCGNTYLMQKTQDLCQCMVVFPDPFYPSLSAEESKGDMLLVEDSTASLPSREARTPLSAWCTAETSFGAWTELCGLNLGWVFSRCLYCGVGLQS